MRAHWYRIFVGECPECGKDAGYRQRVYSPRPERAEDRYVTLPLSFCWCGCGR